MSLITNAQIQKINYGGKGQMLSLKTIEENHILFLRGVTGTRTSSDPTFLNGIPIATSIYGQYRTIHIYKLSRTGSEKGIRTVSEGIPIQLSNYTGSSEYAITCSKYAISFDSSSDRNKDTVMIGSLHIDTDQDGRILMFEQNGNPLETDHIWLGGNPIVVGRFSNGWALGVDY